MSKEYVPPKTVNTQAVKAETPVYETATVIDWNEGVSSIVLASEMVNATKDAVSDTFIEAVNYFIDLLSGKIRISEDKLGEEQIKFMKTLSNSLGLPFDQYCIVTDALVLKLRDNANILKDDVIFSLLYYVKPQAYSRSEVERYKQYFQALSVLSRNLTNRSRIGKMIDIATLAKGYKPTVTKNITQYFQRNYS